MMTEMHTDVAESAKFGDTVITTLVQENRALATTLIETNVKIARELEEAAQIRFKTMQRWSFSVIAVNVLLSLTLIFLTIAVFNVISVLITH